MSDKDIVLGFAILENNIQIFKKNWYALLEFSSTISTIKNNDRIRNLLEDPDIEFRLSLIENELNDNNKTKELVKKSMINFSELVIIFSELITNQEFHGFIPESYEKF